MTSEKTNRIFILSYMLPWHCALLGHQLVKDKWNVDHILHISILLCISRLWIAKIKWNVYYIQHISMTLRTSRSLISEKQISKMPMAHTARTLVTSRELLRWLKKFFKMQAVLSFKKNLHKSILTIAIQISFPFLPAEIYAFLCLYMCLTVWNFIQYGMLRSS